MKTQSKHLLSALSAISFLLILNSCDSIPEDYYRYDNHKEYRGDISFFWPDSSYCCVRVERDSLEFDSIDLTFPKYGSVVNSYREYYYDYTYDSLKVIIDSVQLYTDCFKVDEKDPRVEKNATVYLDFKKNGKTVLFDTLFRETVERGVLDMLPLPRHM